MKNESLNKIPNKIYSKSSIQKTSLFKILKIVTKNSNKVSLYITENSVF